MAKPCPDCKETRDAATGTYTYGSATTGYKTSSDSNIAKKKHRMSYPDAYVPKDYPKPSTPAPAPTPKKKGGAIKKYQAGGSTPRMSPSSVAKGPSKKTGSMNDAVQKAQETVKNTPPTGNNPLNNGVYRGTKLTPAQIKQSQQDWIKKEKQITNPKNKPAGSQMRKLQKGGSIKRK